jgi:hypothetical protein
MLIGVQVMTDSFTFQVDCTDVWTQAPYYQF